MRKTTKGRLFAIFAASALVTAPVTSSAVKALQNVGTPEQTQAYARAVRGGTPALIAFMRAFPNSPLIPQVLAALSHRIGVQAAMQAALANGVDTEVVFATAAELAPGLFALKGQGPLHANPQGTEHANIHSPLSGPY
jgi:hypothetical protein